MYYSFHWSIFFTKFMWFYLCNSRYTFGHFWHFRLEFQDSIWYYPKRHFLLLLLFFSEGGQLSFQYLRLLIRFKSFWWHCDLNNSIHFGYFLPDFVFKCSRSEMVFQWHLFQFSNSSPLHPQTFILWWGDMPGLF